MKFTYEVVLESQAHNRWRVHRNSIIRSKGKQVVAFSSLISREEMAENEVPSSSRPLLPPSFKDDRIKVESLSDARAISGEELERLLKLLNSLGNNEERLKSLESEKVAYLFSSDDLIALVSITESVKTKMAIISTIGPRLTDPKAKPESITGLFRYSEEKEKVDKHCFHCQSMFVSISIYPSANLSIPPLSFMFDDVFIC